MDVASWLRSLGLEQFYWERHRIRNAPTSANSRRKTELAVLLLVGISSADLHALPDPRVDLGRLDQEASNVCARYDPRPRHPLKSC
jgi:hypothetical protein